MDARHAKHRRATEAVETLRSEQESQGATYRIANASRLDARDEVCQIAKALPQIEWSGFLGPVQFSVVESRRTRGPEVMAAVEFRRS